MMNQNYHMMVNKLVKFLLYHIFYIMLLQKILDNNTILYYHNCLYNHEHFLHIYQHNMKFHMSSNPFYSYNMYSCLHLYMNQNIYALGIIYFLLYHKKYIILNHLHNILYNIQISMFYCFNIFLFNLQYLVSILINHCRFYIMKYILCCQYYIICMGIIHPFHHNGFLSYNNYHFNQCCNNTCKVHYKYMMYSHFNLINKHMIHCN